MSDAAAVEHGLPGAYEAPLFGAYAKKVGMWLFLASDSLTFGALLFAFSYNRIYTNPWPTPFHVESITNATIMTACLLSSSLIMVLHGMEWSKLIGEGLTIPGFMSALGVSQPTTTGELAGISKDVPQFSQA